MILILCVISIISCSLLEATYSSYKWELPIEIFTVEEAMSYLVDENNYEYREHNNRHYLPHEFYNKGWGDCKEYALMLQFIFETQLDIKATLVSGYSNGKPHMWIEANRLVYEPTSGQIRLKDNRYESEHKFEYPLSVEMVQFYGSLQGFPIYRY